jgi:hypothetical protein
MLGDPGRHSMGITSVHAEAGGAKSVLVVVVTMSSVAVLTVHVVDMVAMLHGLVTAAGSVGMLVHLGGHVSVDLVLVVVAIVLMMRMTIV